MLMEMTASLDPNSESRDERERRLAQAAEGNRRDVTNGAVNGNGERNVPAETNGTKTNGN